MKIRQTEAREFGLAMECINAAKAHLKAQGIDQWQNGYPDEACIQRDIENGKGYFLVDGEDILGYMCIDFDGEPAYLDLKGDWSADEPYVVMHRLAFLDKARGKGTSDAAFQLTSEFAKSKGINWFRCDTDNDNTKMQHILKKNGFTYRGTIWFDNSEKIAFDKAL